MYWDLVSNLGALLHFQYHSCEVIVYFSRDFSTTFIQYIQHTEVTANQLKSNRCFHCSKLKSMYWNSVSTFRAHLQFQYHCCEEIVYFSRDLSTTFIQYIQHTEVMANQLKSKRCFHCARLKSMYWNSVSTFGALLQFQYHSCEEIVYFSRDFSTTFIQCIQHTEVQANQLKSNRCLHCTRLKSMYWNSVSTFVAHLQFQYHWCEEIVYFSRDFSTAFIHIIQYTEVTANQLKSNRCFHCARMKSMYWNSVSTFGALLQFQYHSCEEIVYFSRDFSTTFIQYIQHTEVTANQLKSNRCFHCARLKSMYWNSVSTFGAHLQFQYHCCEEIVYFSRDFSTAFIHIIQYTEVAANQLKSNRCLHCARMKSMYWDSVSNLGALLHFQYHSCGVIVYFWRYFSTTFIHIIQYTEVTANQLKWNRCFHCARMKSMYWDSVSTFGAHLQFQYHCCEEIVYFSRDLSTTFIQYIQHTEVMANQLKSKRCFHCARLKSMYWNSVSTFGALLQFQYHSCEEIVYFSRDFSTTFIQCIQHTEVKANQLKSNRCLHCARLKSMYWNSVSTFGAHLQFQYHWCEEIVYFSRDFSTTFIQYIQHTEVKANQLKSNRCFHWARLKSMRWNSVPTFGAHLQFQYHCCEEIVYFSRDFSTAFIHIIQYTELMANQQKSNLCFHCARMKSMYWDSVSNLGALLHFMYHSCEVIVYFWRDFSTTFIQYIQHTEVMANQLKSNRCFHCARLKSMYWNSVSTFGALLQFQYHSCEEIVYFSRDFSTTFIQYIQHTEVTANQLNSNRCFHCARLKSMYWNSVSTFGAHLQFQYHCCEGIVYISMDFSTAFIHIIQYTEVTANQLKSNRCFHCARMKSMYWDSVSNLGALLHFQYHSCEVIVYFSRDFSTTFIQYIQHTEVTANQLKSNRCFHCARMKSMYWNSVSTFGALLQFQYHSCEEIVYFSRDFSTTFIQYIQHTEVTANQLKSNRCFHCARLKSMYWNSVSTFGAHLQFQYHCCEEIVYFSRDFSTAFIHIIQYTEVAANQLKSNRCLHCARMKSMYWDSVSNLGALLHFQYHSCGVIVYFWRDFSTTFIHIIQ